jgi:metallo-beta-lactamase family protein
MIKNPNSQSSAITLTSLGGSGGFVTGSCHILEEKNSKFAVDWGSFQGRDEERTARGERMNLSPLGNSLRGLTDILITHAHIDHIGNLPRVYKAGFSPRILSTPATGDLMEVMLENSAHIQTKKKEGERLFGQLDVNKTIKMIQDVDPFEQIPIGQKQSGITAEFIPNGHILGSNSILVRTPSNGRSGRNILFTGDMGRAEHSLDGGYNDYVSSFPEDPINTLVVESTCIEKSPVSFNEKRQDFLSAIQTAWEKGGNPLFPVLSLHRLQEELELLANSTKEGLIEECNVVLDTPLGMKVINCIADMAPGTLSRRYGDDPDYYKSEEESANRLTDIIKNAQIIVDHQDSIYADVKLAYTKQKTIVFASGGMGEHGRAVNYLKGHYCGNPKNTVLFTCHQVDGTSGSRLVRVGEVNLKGKGKGKNKENKKGSEIFKLDGFSSHVSGPEETFEFLSHFNLKDLDTVVVTHGRDPARKTFAQEMVNRGFKGEIVLPRIGQIIEV